MMWIGITGGIGTGKSSFSKILRQKSCKVFDADLISKSLTIKGAFALVEIVAKFGPEVLLPDGELNRKLLGEIVFDDTKKLNELENILHPKIREQIYLEKEKLISEGEKMAFYDVPLLFEKKMTDKFDKVVVVFCDTKLQISRTIQRSGLSKNEVLSRINMQIPIQEKVKLADYKIDNNYTLYELEQKVDDLLKKLAQRATCTNFKK